MHYCHLLESSLSKYEAYLTDTPLYNWNQNLPHFGLASQILTAFFLMITAISIKIFFRLHVNKQGKPKIKNTISFKRLNIIYSLGLIFSALLHVFLMRNESKDAYVLHYSISIVLNTMLLSFILTDHEARAFFKLKFQSWKEERMFNLKMMNVFKTKYKIGPILGADLETGNEIKRSIGIVNDEVFVIDA